MSGCSDMTKCPSCGKDANLYTDWKPFDYNMINCPHCGLQICPQATFMNLQELNEYRKDFELEPLKKLPKQKFEW